VRLLAAWPQTQPNYMDAAYYYVNGENLALGRGFVEDFVWNYLDHPAPPPHPSHTYWMPLTSIVAALGMAIGGIGYRAAQIPFVLLSALLAPLSYLTAWQLSPRRRWGWLAGLLAIFSGFYVAYWAAIDTFTPFALFGGLALLTGGLALENGGRKASTYLFLTGLCAGLAHLTRADGVLLLAALLLLALPRTRPTVAGLGRLLLPLAGYLLVMGPWLARNWLVTGQILSMAGAQTIWLTDYDELFSYGRELSARTFWAQGLGPMVQGRWVALTTNLQTVLAVWGMIFLAPLMVSGGWRWRRLALGQLAALYSLLLFVVMTMVFAFPGARGGLFHSGAALLPVGYALAASGLDTAIEWMTARRRGWRAGTARQVFGAALVGMAIVMSGLTYYPRVLRNNAWNGADAAYPAIAAWVAGQDASAVVMIGNPPAWRYHGGGLSIVVPNEDMTTTRRAAAEYGARYLVLDRNRPAPLAEVYAHPAAYGDSLRLVQSFGEVLVFEWTTE
jgi:4-amino-4-deoxy-L-arabinose transferase-like glycosyltransferase